MANTYITVNLEAGAGIDDKKVKISIDDKTFGFIEEKIVSGSSKVSLKTENPGLIESLSIDVDETNIDHDNLLNFDPSEHVPKDDEQTTSDNLWSAQKTQDELDTKVGKVDSTDNAIPRFDGVEGQLKDSGIIVDDLNNVTGVNDLTVNGNLTVNGEITSLSTIELQIDDANITINKDGNQATAEGAGITVEITDGTDASIVYDSSLESKFKLGEVGSESEIVTVDGNQTILNKTIDADSNTISNIDTLTLRPGVLSTDLSVEGTDQQISSTLSIQTHLQSTVEEINDNINEVSSNLQNHLDNQQNSHQAISVTYDTSTSGLTGTNLQDAVDELASKTGAGLQEYFTLTKEPTGFALLNSNISFDENTRMFTIAPMSTSYDVYVRGTKFTKTQPESVQVGNNGSGNYYIFFNANGVLAASRFFNNTIFTDNALVSIVYWNTENNRLVYFAEERHGLSMDGTTHSYLHNVFGARYISGLALTNFVIGSGTQDNHAQFTANGGTIRDEDLIISIANQQVIPALYKQGNLWRKSTSYLPFANPEGVPDFLGPRMPYNKLENGIWSLQQADNNSFVLMHYFATNDRIHPIVGIQGINNYQTAPEAKAAASSEIKQLSGLPFAEFVPIATVLYEVKNSFTNYAKCRIIQVDSANYIDFRGTQTFTPAGQAGSHGLLSGLFNDDHIQYLTEERADTWYESKISPGDIKETSSTLLQNQTNSNIQNLLFNSASVRSFSVDLSIEIFSDVFLYENIKIQGINKDGEWDYTIESNGDDTLISIGVDSTGQIVYTSGAYTGFISGTFKFRATTLSI